MPERVGLYFANSEYASGEPPFDELCYRVSARMSDATVILVLDCGR